MLIFAPVNAGNIHQQLHHDGKKISFLNFLLEIAEGVIYHAQSKGGVMRRSTGGRPPKCAPVMLNAGPHLPIDGQTRRYCVG